MDVIKAIKDWIDQLESEDYKFSLTVDRDNGSYRAYVQDDQGIDTYGYGSCVEMAIMNAVYNATKGR